MFDLILKGGLLLDGSGSEGVPADLAVSGGRIAAIGHDLGPAAQTLDVAGFCVTPGFLDIHRHGDAEVFREGFGHAELRQGLTTILNGNCGLSLAPFGAAHREEILRYLQPITGGETGGIPTGTMDEYLSALEKRPLPLNVGMLVGNGTVRTDVCGYRAEAPEDFTPIHRRLERALEEGAFAVSLGLGYAPECFYSTEELIRALAPLDHSGVPIAVHMREEGDMVCEAVGEMITVARALHTPLHISHLKAMGMRNWGKRIPHALELMERARQEGMDVSCDVYPYTAGSTQLLHILPPDFLEGGTEAIAARLRKQENRELLRERIRSGHDFDNIAQMVGWDNIVLSTLNLPEHQALTGMTVAQAAERMRLDPVDCVCELLADEHCGVTMIDRITCEEDIQTILRDPYSSVISDSTYPTVGLPHPRVYATCTRILEKYVRQEKILTLPEAVRKLTSLPAQAMRLHGKGLLREGMDADINVFRLEDIHEKATYAAPRQESVGMDCVLVAGRPAILHGRWTGETAGRVLRAGR